MLTRNFFTRAMLLASVFGFALAATPAAAKQLVIYDASNEVHAVVVEAFKTLHPDIDIKVVEGSTGPIAERAIAEKSNPQADIVYLVNEAALDQLKRAGVFAPYEPKDPTIPAEYRDPDGFYLKLFYTTMCMVVNKDRLAEKHLPMPSTWEDLIKPVYKHEIALPSPLKSGTGGVILTTMVDAFGWNYVENLAQNVYQWSDGGSGGANLAGNGEVTIGLSFDTTCFGLKAAGKPVDVVFGPITPGDTEGGGLVANGPNPVEGKLYMDFLASDAAAAALTKMVGATTAPGHGLVNLSDITIWSLRRPVEINDFRKEFAKRILKQ
ncbi:MAG: extracellular solute-binding protein [Ancalomicrobiaceae bacterium]|nr:extracellular solute-binding protein [Ancalomicrobiaceae bacterium]